MADAQSEPAQALPDAQSGPAQALPKREEGKAALSANPTFDRLFRAQVKRRIFCATKKRAAAAKPTPADILQKLQARLGKVKKCCNRKICRLSHLRGDQEFLQNVADWRLNWHLTPRHMRREALLHHLQKMQTVAKQTKSKPMQSKQSELSELAASGDCHVCTLGDRPSLVLPSSSTNLEYAFLGLPFCQRAFAALTGVNAFRTGKAMKEGMLTIPKEERCIKAPRRDEMVGAIWSVVKDLHDQSPFAKHAARSSDSEWHMPFHHKVCLWRLILRAHEGSKDGDCRWFTEEPAYPYFRKCILLADFKTVIFHRVVDIGRCAKCEYFKWKLRSCPPLLRPVWQDAFAKHHLLQIQQKRCYMADRARAAQDFPRSELYLAMDCGSGNEFVFPHLSRADREGPNKAIDGFATVPLKVCNGLLHGDTRSHVILSPGVIGATANHTCECLLIMINTCFLEHLVLPSVLSLQFDGASTNKCMLVLAFMALYVLEGVFSTVRARCEMENHAHDLYDSFHAVHAVKVRDSSFCFC